MKYTTNIFPEGTGYRGQIISLESGIVYTSEVLTDPIAVSRNLVTYINSIQEKPTTTERIPPIPLTQPINKPRVVIPGDLSNVSTTSLPPLDIAPQVNAYTPPPRRCCGRG